MTANLVRPDGVFLRVPSKQVVKQFREAGIDIVSHKTKKEGTMCTEVELRATAISIAESLGNEYANECIRSQDQRRYHIPRWLVRVYHEERLMRCVLTADGVSKVCEYNIEYDDEVLYEELDDA